MEEQILAYLEKKLPTETRQAFETALINDAVLQKEFQIQRELWEKLRLLRLRNKVKDIIAETDAKKGAMEADIEQKRKEDFDKWEQHMSELPERRYYGMNLPTYEAAGPIDTPIESKSSKDDFSSIKEKQLQKAKFYIFGSISLPSWWVYIGVGLTITGLSIALIYHLSKTGKIPLQTPYEKNMTSPIDSSSVLAPTPLPLGKVIPLSDANIVNLDDFIGEKSVLRKHLSQIDCRFEVSFIVKANGKIKIFNLITPNKDSRCELLVLEVMNNLPQLKPPMSKSGKTLNFEFTFYNPNL